MREQEMRQNLSRGQREYFKDSKIRDDEGNLLIVHVATKMQPGDVLLYKPTAYTDPSYLKDINGFQILSMYANAENPYYYNGAAELQSIAQEHNLNTMGDLVDYFKQQGYDSIVGENQLGVKEVTVFEPNQLKSIGNRFPTKSDYSLDNSEEYLRTNLRMPISERFELAKTIKNKKMGKGRDEFGELERKGAFER